MSATTPDPSQHPMGRLSVLEAAQPSLVELTILPISASRLVAVSLSAAPLLYTASAGCR